MQETFINNGIQAGYVHSYYFSTKKSSKGKQYYRGNLNISTSIDNPGTEVTQVNFAYIEEGTECFSLVEKLIKNKMTIKDSGIEGAMKVCCYPNLTKNEYFSMKYKDENGNPGFSSRPQLEAFCFYENENLSDEKSKRNRFSVDALITGVQKEEGSDAEGIEPKAVLHCGIFTTKKEGDVYKVKLVPFDFPVYDICGINYFTNVLKISDTNPVFTRLVGDVKVTVEEPKKPSTQNDDDEVGAFGEEEEYRVTPTAKTTREFVIINARKTPYTFGLEDTLTVEDVKTMMKDREIMLKNLEEQCKQNKEKKDNDSNTAFNSASSSFNNTAENQSQEFMIIPDGVTEELPFDL